MTQIDYDRIAETLNRALHYTLDRREDGLGQAIRSLAQEFDDTDIRFNVTRFLNTSLK